MMKSTLTVGLLTLLFAVSAVAETYMWEDSTGTVNFAEDLSQVPKKYRKKVQVRGDLSAPTPEPSSAVTEPGAAKGSTSVPASSDAGKPVVGNEKKDLLYGGKSGEEWRRDFASLKADLRSTDDQIAELNGRMADTSQMSRADFLGIQSSLKSLQFHKVEVGKKLDALSQAASRARVPAEFR
jgi:hypothetical protein